MSSRMSVCEPWPIDPSCCDLPEDIDPAVLERWQMVATQILWRLSGRRWGPSCPITVRPCRRSCVDDLIRTAPWRFGTVGNWIPYLGTDGVWRNANLCGCTTSCSCTELCEIHLQGPVYDIVEVQDGDLVLPAEAYRVDEPNRLVRTDGNCWPACQDMQAPCGEPGTLCVTYRIGLPLNEAAIAAVSELTCHLARGCTGGGSCGCKANPNVTRLQRQGVTMEMADPTVIYSEGRTGIAAADLWLAAVNPYRLASPSRVYSPDFRRPRRQQWP